MKVSALWSIDATRQAFKHDAHLLELVRKGSGTLEAKLNGHDLFQGSFDEPHDIDKRYEIASKILKLAEQYLEATMNATRNDLAKLGLDVDG